MLACFLQLGGLCSAVVHMRNIHAPRHLWCCCLASPGFVLVLLQFSQMPHYHLVEATAAAKEVMGPYYREPMQSPGPIPTHLIEPLRRSLTEDQVVDDSGDIVYYEKVAAN